MIRTIVVERWSLFQRLLPSDVYFWLKALLLALIAVQAARLIWIIVTPVGPFGEWKPATARLLPPLTQTALVSSVDPFFRGSQASEPVAEASVTGLQLFGVRQEGAAGGGSAIIGTEDGEQDSFAVGEEVVPGVRLAAVAFDYVILARGEQQQRLAFEDAETGADGGETATASAPSEGAAAGQPLTAAAVRQAVGFSPRQQGGRVTGVIVNPARDAELFRSVGFQQGDVITAVNGARITSATDVAQLQSGLSPGARLSLTVERGAQTVPISLYIAGN